MLGLAVGQYFDAHPDYETYLSHRNSLLAYGKNTFEFDVASYIENAIPTHVFDGFDYVINCIGGIKQHSFTLEQFHLLNQVLPARLGLDCNLSGAKLIHVSSDCVFSGKKGNYNEEDVPDPTDAYGTSKFVGERPDFELVLRTSLIGEELHTCAGLIGWAKSQAGKEVNGFTNHIWNGITTKQFAKSCDDIIQKNLHSRGLFHIFNPTPVSKFEMLEAINAHFDLGLKINCVEMPERIDRTLTTLHSLCGELRIPSFHDMITTL